MDQELDPYICGCIIEFLVRYSPDDMHVKKVIDAFPPLKPRPQLKKAVLLRTMRTEVNAGDVSEKTLDALEKIGCIDSNQGLPIPDSMKEAYCAVALECTVKYLPGDTDTCGGKYLDAVDRIWRGRIQDLERSKASDLVFDQLRNRRLQVEAAATGDEDAVRCLSAINTRGYAIVSLRRYLREASGSMKPPVLEQACLKLGRAFMESELPTFKEKNPQLEVVTELIRGQHPHLKNMIPEDILLYATRLRNALGRKVVKLKTRHVTKHPSVQGTWTTDLKF